MADDSRFVTDPDRLRELLAERFVPWPDPPRPVSKPKWSGGVREPGGASGEMGAK